MKSPSQLADAVRTIARQSPDAWAVVAEYIAERTKNADAAVFSKDGSPTREWSIGWAAAFRELADFLGVVKKS